MSKVLASRFSRRGFFREWGKNCAGRALEILGEMRGFDGRGFDLVRSVANDRIKLKPHSLDAVYLEELEKGWQNLVQCSEVSPGTVHDRVIDGVDVRVFSDHYGVWAEGKERFRFGLRICQNRWIQIHLSERWSDQKILSHLTGNIEDRSDEVQIEIK